jgi:hypothetical protein
MMIEYEIYMLKPGEFVIAYLPDGADKDEWQLMEFEHPARTAEEAGRRLDAIIAMNETSNAAR